MSKSGIPIVSNVASGIGSLAKGDIGGALGQGLGVASSLAGLGAISPLNGTLSGLASGMSGGLPTGGIAGPTGSGGYGGGYGGNPQVNALNSYLAQYLMGNGGLNTLFQNPNDGQLNALQGENAKLPGLTQAGLDISGYKAGGDPYALGEYSQQKLNQDIALRTQQKAQAEQQLRQTLAKRGIPSHVIDMTVQRQLLPMDQEIANYRSQFQENARQEKAKALLNAFGQTLQTGQVQTSEDARDVASKENQQRNLAALYGFLMSANNPNGMGGAGAYQIPTQQRQPTQQPPVNGGVNPADPSQNPSSYNPNTYPPNYVPYEPVANQYDPSNGAQTDTPYSGTDTSALTRAVSQPQTAQQMFPALGTFMAQQQPNTTATQPVQTMQAPVMPQIQAPQQREASSRTFQSGGSFTGDRIRKRKVTV